MPFNFCISYNIFIVINKSSSLVNSNVNFFCIINNWGELGLGDNLVSSVWNDVCNSIIESLSEMILTKRCCSLLLAWGIYK